MNFFRHASIRQKQMRIIMGICSFALLLATAAFVIFDSLSRRKEMASFQLTRGDVLGRTCWGALDFKDARAAEENLNALQADPHMISATVFSADGMFFARYSRAGAAAPAPNLFSTKAVSVFERGRLRAAQPIVRGNELLGFIVLESDLKALDKAMTYQAGIAALVFTLATALAFFLSSRLQRLISGPILGLLETTRAVAADRNYALRARKESDDELGQLVDGFNDMLQQVQSRDAELQQAQNFLELRVEDRTKELQNEVAERQQAEERLQESLRSLASFKAVLDRACTIATTDEHGTITHANDNLCKISGYSREELLGQNHRLLKSGHHPEAFFTEMWRTIAQGDIWRGEVKNRAKSGRTYWEDTTIGPLLDDDGKPKGYLAIRTDITERKKADEERARLVDFLEASLNEVYVFDPETLRFSYVNRSARENLGYTPEQIAKLTPVDLKPGFTEEAFRQAIAPLLAGAAPKHVFQTVHRRADGSDYPVEVCLQLVATGTERVFLAVINDITERRKQEQELQRTQSFLNSVIEHLPIPIFIKEAGELRFVLWNKAGESLTGISNAEMIGKNDFDFFPAESAAEFVAKDRETLDKRQALDIPEEVLHTRTRGDRLVHVRKVPILDQGGQPTHLLGIAEDITDRKEAEAKLTRMNDRLIETSRLAGMTEVATSVLHNVGNVLNSVNVSATLVADTVRKSEVAYLAQVCTLLREHAADLGTFLTSDPTGCQVPAFLDTLVEHLAAEQNAMLQELTHLTKNIDHIKEIVAMQQSYAKVSGVNENLDPVELIEDAVRMNAGSFLRHDVELRREFVPELPRFCVDKHKVLQILINLLRNAKYACDDSGRTDKAITIRASNDDGRVRITVADNGVGIPAENLNRIFNHGFTTRSAGHGFGLHSGANAAREMGGNLTVHSAGPGCGAAFTLELPAKPPEAAAKTLEAA